MNAEQSAALVAVDVGNSRLKFGLFEPQAAATLPSPSRTLEIASHGGDFTELSSWLRPFAASAVEWRIGSVFRAASTRLIDWLRSQDAAGQAMLLCAADLPLRIELERPDMVGIDRLLAAVAANRLRRPQNPAVVVDSGSALTVDLVSAEGAFQGGAILPGMAMAARALHEFTDLLPLIDSAMLLEPPAALGRSTVEAMRSGLYWGAVGAIRELVGRLALGQGASPDVFLSGGAAASIAQLLPMEAQYAPDLVLSGIAIAAGR